MCMRRPLQKRKCLKVDIRFFNLFWRAICLFRVDKMVLNTGLFCAWGQRCGQWGVNCNCVPLFMDCVCKWYAHVLFDLPNDPSDAGNMTELHNMIWKLSHNPATARYTNFLILMPYIPEFQCMFSMESSENFKIDCSMFNGIPQILLSADSSVSTLHLWSTLLQPLLLTHPPLSSIIWGRPLISILTIDKYR